MNKYFIIFSLVIALAGCRSLQFLESHNLRNLDVEAATELTNAICDTYKKLVETFRTSKKSKLVRQIIKEGFSRFVGSGQVQITGGVKADKYSRFMDSLLTKIELGPKYISYVKATLEEADMARDQQWLHFDLMFSKDGARDQVKYCSVLVFNRDDKLFDVIYSDLKASFKFAKNIDVIRKSKSILGGIFESEKEVEIEKPKDLTQEDLENLFTFFEIIAFKLLAKKRGIDLTLPKY